MTWALPSGRTQGRMFSLRTSASLAVSWWDSEIGSGMSSSVSVQAKPTIIPWSPAPSAWTSSPLPCTSPLSSLATSTPWAISGDCSSTDTDTPQDL